MFGLPLEPFSDRPELGRKCLMDKKNVHPAVKQSGSGILPEPP
jgi:hypothetical protein